MSQQFANIGTWEWQVQTGDLWWSERIAPMFGGEDSEMETSYENFISAVHPDDRGKVQQAIQQCLEAEAEYDIEHRVVWPNGEVRWLHEKGDVLRDTQGVPVTMLGAVQEITQKKAFGRLMLNQQKLLDIVHSTTLNYLTTQDFEGFCQHMLEGVLNLSGAEMGVIGEVFYTGTGTPYLESHATAGMPGFSVEDASLTPVFESHEWVISNAPGAMEGQGVVDNYIGMPVTLGEELLGMLVLANRQGGFDQTLYEFLIPFIATYGVMILSKRLQERDKNRMVELQAAKSKAEQANRAKSEFLSSMSHELRTPLNSILGFGDLLEMSELNSTQRDQLNEIRKSGTHLLSLINDILDLAKIDAGHLNLNLEQVSLCHLLRECTPMLEQLLAERSVTLELACLSDRESEVLGDYIRVKQVVITFLSNAIKYNRRGGSVKATINPVERRSGRFVQLSVEDTGMGVPGEQRDKVFEPFNRLGRESKSIEGTGIGLSICQSLIHAMNGRIGFESEVGVGSRFWIELPEITDEERQVDIHSDHSKEQETMNDALLSRSDTDRQVLYIEDNVANMKLMSGIVKKLPNVELTISVTAEEGIEKAKTLSPDLILVDLNLPGMSGQEALPHLRALPNLQANQTEIVALTANAMKGDVEAGLELGFDDYLTKPIDLQKVMALLNKTD